MTFPIALDAGQDAGQESDPKFLKKLRQALIDKLFIQPIVNGDEIPKQLSQIVRVLSRTATNEPTAYENGAVSTSATSSASLLTRQVERALTQVLGRAPGRGAEGFIQALNSAFPTAANGRVMFTPARGVVSLYSPYGEGNQVISGKYGTALTGQLSVEQANLYRQASIIITDALKVLEGLQPFDPTADLDAVEALRALIRAQMTSLIEEFGRFDEPRGDRVNVYFITLKNHLKELGKRARLISTPSTQSRNEEVFPVTADDEAQVAAFELLNNYVGTLELFWQLFLRQSPSEQLSDNYSARLSRVSVLLPVIADSNASFMAAMDSIGFSESERRSDAALFTSLGPATNKCTVDSTKSEGFRLIPNDVFNKCVPLPDITVNDFNEWVDRFATIEAPSILASSGRFGLDFVTDQADTLFWVIGFVLYFINENLNQEREPFLEKVLTFDRVKQTLSELVFQLDTLADFGVPDSDDGNNPQIVVRSSEIPPPPPNN
jgi:hypothetical protein